MEFQFDLKQPLGTLADCFTAGMNPKMPTFIPVGVLARKYLNLGAGEKKFSWARPLQRPEWDAETQEIPEPPASVDGIVAFHFLEHITRPRVAALLADCARVLKPRGTLTIIVPYGACDLAIQDLD